MRAAFTSPLLHFSVLGALIFGAFMALDDTPEGPNPDAIVMTSGTARSLADQFESTWGRAPSDDDLRLLMKAWVLQEALVREARAMGLDQGDTVIRQRLSHKIRFLAEGGEALTDPGDAVLQAYLDANPTEFEQGARISFEQVTLPGGATAAEVLDLKERLNDGGQVRGVPSLLPGTVTDTPVVVLDRTFGSGFGAAVAALPIGAWDGPVTSGYGRHLVRVSGMAAPVLPPLNDIRDAVLRGWQSAERDRQRRDMEAAVLARYEIVLPDLPVPAQ